MGGFLGSVGGMIFVSVAFVQSNRRCTVDFGPQGVTRVRLKTMNDRSLAQFGRDGAWVLVQDSANLLHK